LKKRAIAALALTAALFFAGCAGNTEGTEGGTYFVQFDMQRQNVFIDGEQIGASEFTPLSGKMRDRIAALEEEFSTDLAGSEMFEVSLGDFAVKTPAGEDAPAYGSAPTSAAGMLCEGRFALFLAGEPYKTGIKAQGCGKVKQAAFLIALDEDGDGQETEA